MRKTLIAALLTMVAACESTIPHSQLNPGKAAGLDSRKIIREFENQIATKLITDFTANPTGSIPLYQSVEAEIKTLDTVTQRLSTLNQALLTSKNRHASHQLNMRQAFRSSELDTWLHSNHLNALTQLLPPLVFERIEVGTLENVITELNNTPQALKRLRSRLEKQRSSGIHYPDQLLSNSIAYIHGIKDPNNSPLFSRFSQLLSFSDLDAKEQKSRFEAFQKGFLSSTYPAYSQFAGYLEEQLDNADPDGKMIGGSRTLAANIDIEKSAGEIISNLRTDLELLQYQIKGIESSTSQTLEQIYADPRYSVKNQPDPYQTALNLLSIYAIDIQIDLLRWFSNRPSRPALITANDQVNVAPFTYQDGIALFDLATLVELPTFELEALAYQYIVPGQHLLNIDLIPKGSPLAQAYRNGWSLYALGKTRDYDQKGEYFGNDFAILGLLVRSKLATCKAISDLNLQLENWSAVDARLFITENTPYPAKFIAREVNHILANPGLAVNAYLISRELENLHSMAVNQGNVSPREYHATILAHSPATVAFLREELSRELKKKASGEESDSEGI